jgi:aspartyl-tRNA(Asn)/glutamyl-tRNA(Gln) amidotransferase subunit C
MKLSQQEVEKVAELARIQVSEAEKEQLSHHLSSILTYMEELNQVDTKGVSPMASVVSQSNVLREDEVRDSVPQGKAVENAPAAKDGLFQVPKIISDH